MGKPQRTRPGSRVKLQLMGLADSASPAEAAAVVAALERFLGETRPAPSGSHAAIDPWLRASLLEGVSREPRDDLPEPWI